jgi:hypothetical protein
VHLTGDAGAEVVHLAAGAADDRRTHPDQRQPGSNVVQHDLPASSSAEETPANRRLAPRVSIICLELRASARLRFGDLRALG